MRMYELTTEVLDVDLRETAVGGCGSGSDTKGVGGVTVRGETDAGDDCPQVKLEPVSGNG